MKKKLSKGGRSGSSNSISRESFSTTTIVMLLGSHALSFLCGSLYGSKDIFLGTLPPDQQMPVITTTSSCPSCPECPPCTPATDTRQEQEIANREALFPDTVKKYAVGMTYTSKNEFVEKFDSGVPWDEPTAKGDKDVLFIYANEKAMPNKKQESNSQALEYFSVDEATENCNFMHVLLNHRGGEKHQCLAIVPQYESFHLQKWMRVPSKGEGNPSLPLRLVSRGHQWNGISNFDPPVLERQTQRFWRLLRTFLDSFEGMKEELKPIVKKIAVKNTIIVMTCNLGQSELLLNFVCSAKSRGLDIGNILVFATDPETKELAESIGLTAYYNDDNFGHMPTDAASGRSKAIVILALF